MLIQFLCDVGIVANIWGIHTSYSLSKYLIFLYMRFVWRGLRDPPECYHNNLRSRRDSNWTPPVGTQKPYRYTETNRPMHIRIRPFNCRRYADWLRAGRPSSRSSSPSRVKNFLFSTSSRPVLGSTQPTIRWVPWATSPGGLTGKSVNLTTHLQLVPRSRICEFIHPLPHTPSWCSASLVKHRYNFIS
jgi:hypothetical protein